MARKHTRTSKQSSRSANVPGDDFVRTTGSAEPQDKATGQASSRQQPHVLDTSPAKCRHCLFQNPMLFSALRSKRRAEVHRKGIQQSCSLTNPPWRGCYKTRSSKPPWKFTTEARGKSERLTGIPDETWFCKTREDILGKGKEGHDLKHV